jgi:DNA repair exonuclease SbcCD ATPase subunit
MSDLTPDRCLELAQQAVKDAERAKAVSEYPRLGFAVYSELRSAYEQLAMVLARTEEAVRLEGLDRVTKRKRRVARLERRAAYLRVEACKEACRSHDTSSRVPFGQPILVGHHSEKRHRRTLERAQNQSRKSNTLWEAAREAEHKAQAAAGNDAIYSNDEDAIERLDDKVAALERKRDRMKEVNAAYRKAKKDIDKMEGLTDYERSILKSAKESFYLGPNRWMPFEPYQLSNLGARIRDAKKRAATIQARDERPENPERMIGNVRVVENREFHKLELHFPGKPSAEVIAKLKYWGFRWIRTAGCWSRANDNNTEWRLQEIAKVIGAELVEA